MDGIIDIGFHVVSKLCRDAHLLRIYNRLQKARGRKKKFDSGGVQFSDFEQSTVVKIDFENIESCICTAFSKSLKLLINIVLFGMINGR